MPQGTITVNGNTCVLAVTENARDENFTIADYDTGPISLNVNIPVGATGSWAAGDNGWGHGYAVAFVEDHTLHIDSDQYGAYCQVEATALVPATLPNPGHEWLLVLSATPTKPEHHADTKAFHSNAVSGKVTVRV